MKNNINSLPARKKHICIIGAGSSGIILMKELQEAGHTFTCFESFSCIGGVYAKSNPSTLLTTSSVLTAWSFFSDNKENSPVFWTIKEYLTYLNNVSTAFHLKQYINFNTTVKTVRRTQRTARKWLVIVEDSNKLEKRYYFDVIAVCSGTNNFPYLPSFPCKELFTGNIIHSSQYKNPGLFQGKHVVVVGGGESASDIIDEVSSYAKSSAIVIRDKHGHIIPRIQSDGYVTDLNTNRSRYSNPYVFGGTIGYIVQIIKKIFSFISSDTNNRKVIVKTSEMNIEQGTSAFSKFGCKNDGFVRSIVLRQTELHRGEITLDGDEVIFSNGNRFKCDYIIACTGFRNAFPYFEKYHPDIAYNGMNPRTNYKQIMNILYPTEVGFFGFARPAFGSIPPTVEMQSRFFIAHLDGNIETPTINQMTDVINSDTSQWNMRFGYDSKRIKGLVDFQVYVDSLAEMIGCMPNLLELFFTKPYIWYKIMFGPFTMHQFRIYGPNSNPDRAYHVYSRQPVGNFLENMVTFSLLIVAKLLYLIGFTKFKPNSF
jgi:dimethylaniline monooxygenase (N-oxide forming)